MVFGIWAFSENGIISDLFFAIILFTTRNQSLDDLAKGYTLGSQPLDKMIGKTRLRFGLLESENIGRGVERRVERRVGFGLESEVSAL